ncbi:MAG: ABC transporter ATP-binding protein [SAR324 cluster bacterium]|nr:ABC transporter ATP-binding protein [SAR324 cluster bacterium]
MTLLRLENLTVSIDTARGPIDIIQKIDLEMAAGEKLGIVGESGCGKSITALAIMSLLPERSHVSGKILLNGEDLLALSPSQMCKIRGNQVAMIFQEPMTALNPVKTIGNQIAESLYLHLNLRKKEARDRVCQLMESVGLPVGRFPLGLYPHQLSGGQRQRVMIAMAIACEPALLIADEPTTALDVTVQEQILDLILALADRSGMGLIMISHDLGVIAQTTDKITVMYTGNMFETGPTTEVFKHMAHPYTHGLFSAIPKSGLATRSDRTRLYTIPGHVPEIHLRPGGCSFADRCDRALEQCNVQKPPAVSLESHHQAWCYNPLERT